MSHLFLSYSRRDSDFVRRLNDALKACGRETWVDWEGIRPSAEWLKEIYAAIDAADAFVFVISPDSAASRECHRELDHAVARHKRLVPIVYRDASQEALGDAISSHNWIFCREGDDFEAALDALIAAADTDLEWVHAHTRLLTRALEWDASGRDNSFALVGTDLRRAEQRLAQAGEKQPRLTRLHVEYVLASRNSATRRLLLTRGAATVAACIFALLLVVAWTVDRQAKLFLARDLHARAVSALGDRDILTARVLLGKSLTLEDRPETRERLLEAQIGGAALEWAVAEPGRVAALSPDGARFALDTGAEEAGADPGVRLWDVAQRRESVRLSSGGGTGAMTVACFSPDGKRLATAGSGHRGDGVLRVWDTAAAAAAAGAGKPLCAVPVGRGADIGGLAFGADGGVLATAGSDRTVRLWDVPAATPRRTLSGFAEQVTCLAFSPDGALLACGGWDQEVSLWDAAAGRRRHLLRGHEAQVTALAFSPDGTLLATAGWDARIWLWDVRTGQRLRSLLGHRSGVLSVAFSPDGRRIASGSANGLTRVWDAETGRNVVALRGHDAGVSSVAFLPGSRRLVTGDRHGGVRVWNIGRAEGGPEERALRGHTEPTTTVEFSPDGKLLASGSQDRTVRLWDAKTGQAVRTLRGHRGGVFCLAFAPDGKTLASGGRGAMVRLWDVGTGRPLRVLEHGGAVREVSFRPDGGLLATAGDDGAIRLWEPATGRLLRRLPGEDPLLCVAFSPDGRHLVSGTQEGDLQVWDVSDADDRLREPTLAGTLRGHSEAVWGVNYSPDGRWIGSGSEDGTVRLWDAATLRSWRQLRAHEGAVWDLTFSPDGRRLATVGSGAALRLWDLGRDHSAAPGRPRTLRGGGDGTIWWVRFRRDGRLLATAGQDRAVRVWDLDRTGEVFAEDPRALLTRAEQETGLRATSDDTVTSVAPIAPGRTGGSGAPRP